MDGPVYHPEDCMLLPHHDPSFEHFIITNSLLSHMELLDEYPFTPMVDTLHDSKSEPSPAPASLKMTGGQLAPTVLLAPEPNGICSTLGTSSSDTANLDEVPMDLVTSEDDVSDDGNEIRVASTELKDYNTLFTEVLSKPCILDPQSNDTDEIELRSRALRSLLLKRQRSEIRPNSKHPHTVQSFEACVSKRLCIGSGKEQSLRGDRQKFVITVCDSSETDEQTSAAEEPDTQVTTVQTLTIFSSAPTTTPALFVDELNKSNTRPSVVLSEPSVTRKEPEATDKRLLHLKMRLLRLKLTIKRQERIVEERRKVTQDLISTSKALRKQLKQNNRRIRDSNELALEAERVKASLERRVLLVQERYDKISETLNSSSPKMPPKPIIATRLKSTISASSPMRSSPRSLQDYLRKKLASDSLAILLEARVSTAYFSFYRFEFFSPDLKQKELGPNHTGCAKPNLELNVPKLESRINPMIPLCPYLIDGDCKDNHCPWQHPTDFNTSNRLKHTQFASVPTMQLSDLYAPPESSTTHFCPVCKRLVAMTNSDHTQSDAIRKWHTHYLTWKRFSAKESLTSFSQFRKVSSDLVTQHPTDYDLSRHHLAILCATPQTTRTNDIMEYLVSTNFSLRVLRLVLRHSALSCASRQSIAQSCLNHLLPVIQSSTHLTDILSIPSTAFVYIVYHLALLHFESESNEERLKTLLDGIISSFPRSHPVRYGLWWFKLALVVDKRLPNEDALFSLANLPAYKQTRVMANRCLILEAATDLRIPDDSVDLFESISPWDDSSILPVCYLAVVFVYVQLLLGQQRYQVATDLCLRLATTLGLISTDDLFFPIGVFAMFRLKSFFDWSTFVSTIAEPHRSRLGTSFRIEFGFLLAHFAWQKNSQQQCKFAIVESLASLILLPSDDDVEILRTFEELLGLHTSVPQSGSSLKLLCDRGRTYLLLTYGLFSLIYSTDWTTTLDFLLRYYRERVLASTGGGNETFVRLLLHMIVTFLNRTYDLSDGAGFMEKLACVMFARPLSLQQCLTPSWFIELVQRINFASLPSPGFRHDICIRLVETYGSRLIPPLCRSLFVLDDRFLAQSLCAIGRLDQPDQVEFWLLYAALLVCSPTGCQSSATTSNRTVDIQRQKVELTELFADAVTAVPSSRRLWEQYAWAVHSMGTGTEELLRRAQHFQMLDVVSRVDPSSSKYPPVGSKSQAPVTTSDQQIEAKSSEISSVSRPSSSSTPSVVTPKTTSGLSACLPQVSTSTSVVMPASSNHGLVCTTTNPRTSRNPITSEQGSTSVPFILPLTANSTPLMSLVVPPPSLFSSWVAQPRFAVPRAPLQLTWTTPSPLESAPMFARPAMQQDRPSGGNICTVPHVTKRAPLLGDRPPPPFPNLPSPSIPPLLPPTSSTGKKKKKRKRKPKSTHGNTVVPTKPN